MISSNEGNRVSQRRHLSRNNLTRWKSLRCGDTNPTHSIQNLPTMAELTVNAEARIESVTFDTFGILEHILSYSQTNDLLAATAVSRRWREAGRNDALWEAAITRLWDGKVGVASKHPLFWRSLFTKDAVQRIRPCQIRAIFEHPLLVEKRSLIDKCSEHSELQRFFQVHMLDVMSDGSEWHRFFSDIFFGSFVCSVLDSKRELITQSELSTPFGFDMYFKIAQDEVDDGDRTFLTEYDDAEGVLLYHHSTCFFEESREFQIVLKQHVHSYHPTDLKWRWLEVGKRIQVGPYPPLTISRRKDWGWKLENLHVVLLFRDCFCSGMGEFDCHDDDDDEEDL